MPEKPCAALPIMEKKAVECTPVRAKPSSACDGRAESQLANTGRLYDDLRRDCGNVSWLGISLVKNVTRECAPCKLSA